MDFQKEIVEMVAKECAKSFDEGFALGAKHERERINGILDYEEIWTKNVINKGSAKGNEREAAGYASAVGFLRYKINKK